MITDPSRLAKPLCRKKKKIYMSHLTPDTWHVTLGGWWTLCKSFSSLALSVWAGKGFEDLKEKDDSSQWINEWISHKAVCRTAPVNSQILESSNCNKLSCWLKPRVFTQPASFPVESISHNIWFCMQGLTKKIHELWVHPWKTGARWWKTGLGLVTPLIWRVFKSKQCKNSEIHGCG